MKETAMSNKFVSGMPGPEMSKRRTIEQTLLAVRKFSEEKRRKKGLVPTAETSTLDDEGDSQQPSSVEKEDETSFKVEQANAEDWYANHIEWEKAQAARAAAWDRRDHLLPEDELPI